MNLLIGLFLDAYLLEVALHLPYLSNIDWSSDVCSSDPLMDDAYPYTLIDHFALTDPELLERVPPADRYRFFRDCTRMAAEYGIRDAKKLVMVCTWALLLGEGFHQEPDWQQRLQDLGAGRRTTRQITDEVWPVEEETWDE